MNKELIIELEDGTFQYSDPNGKFSAEAETEEELIEKVTELEEVTKYVR